MSESATARMVSLAVTIDGMTVGGAIELELVQCGHFSADRFRVVFATGAVPGGAGYFAALGSGVVSVGVGVGVGVGIGIGIGGGFLAGIGAGGGALLVGQIDNVAVDFGRGQAVVSGRDLSARLIDAEVTESFANQTASQIASQFAADAGLAAAVTATSTPVGQYYELAHTRTALALHSRHMTRWDLLAGLALTEQFALSVTGTTLNFAPVTDAVQTVLHYGQDFISLVVDRAVGLGTPKVTVASWNPKSKQAVSSSVGSSGGVTLVRPNLTQGEAAQLASAHQAELAAQAVLLRGSMPGDLSLMPGSVFVLAGTGTGFDTSYRIRTIERHVDVIGGFVQRFEALQVI
ncbi:MAG: hypothetical protein PHI71_04980 [Acidiphilium sp.]|nr:hypothetical protein [Acidiphilium sp.]